MIWKLTVRNYKEKFQISFSAGFEFKPGQIYYATLHKLSVFARVSQPGDTESAGVMFFLLGVRETSFQPEWSCISKEWLVVFIHQKSTHTTMADVLKLQV